MKPFCEMRFSYIQVILNSPEIRSCYGKPSELIQVIKYNYKSIKLSQLSHRDMHWWEMIKVSQLSYKDTHWGESI